MRLPVTECFSWVTSVEVALQEKRYGLLSKEPLPVWPFDRRALTGLDRNAQDASWACAMALIDST